MKSKSLFCVGWLLMSVTVASASLQDGLVAYFPMNEGQGTTVADTSGNRHNGTISGTNTQWIDSVPGQGKAIEFLGSSKHCVNVGTWNPSGTSGEFAVSLWMRWSGSNGYSQGIITKRSGSDWQILINRSNESLTINGSGASPWFGSQVPPLREWQHVVFMFDGDTTTTMWINGQLAGSSTLFVPPRGTDAPIVIGAIDSSGNQPFNGALDDVRFYNRTLTREEIAEAAGQTDDGLVAYYPFHGDARDASGHGRHGVVHGATLTKDHRNVDDCAYEFDGIDDYIYFGPVLPDMDQMTISLWVYTEAEAKEDPSSASVLFCDGDWAPGQDVILTTDSGNRVIMMADKAVVQPMGWPGEGYHPLYRNWRHLVWVVTGTVFRYYVDYAIDNDMHEAKIQGSNRGNHNFIVGTEEYPQGTFGYLHGFWKGRVSELRIYNRALSNSEVRDLYYLEPPAVGQEYASDGRVGQGVVLDCALDGNADDVSGNARHGTVNGPTPTRDQNGRENGAYEFDGVDDYISFGDMLPDMLEMTVSLWLRCDPGGSGASIFFDGDGTQGNDVLFGIDASNRAILTSNKNGGGLNNRFTVTPQFAGQWRHVVWLLADVWTSLYIDGAECRTLERGGPNLGHHGLVLGSQEYPAGHIGDQGFWKGAVSSLRVYDSILSDEEIAALYERDKPVDFNKGLVASYPFAGDAQDHSGHGRHGTVKGATPTADQYGVPSGAYELDGVDDCIYFGPVLPDMNEMTLCAWVYSPSVSGNFNTKPFFCEGDWEQSNDTWFEIRRFGAPCYVRLTATKNGSTLDNTLYVPYMLSNRWTQLVWVLAGSYSSVYGDGRELVTILNGGNNRGYHNFIFGASEYPEGTLSRWWKGKISSVKIYDRALSKAEITAMYDQEVPGADTVDLANGLVARYPMNEGEGSKLVDASGNGHNGAIYGDEIHWIESLPGYGQALEFPGTWHQYVDAGNWDPSQGTGQLTVAFWMKWNGPNGAYQGIVAKRSGRDDAGICWQIMVDLNNYNVTLSRYNVTTQLGVCVPLVNQWQHVAYTFDGTTATRYVDGGPVLSDVFSLSPAANTQVVIGALARGGNQPFNGALDDVRLYNRALTPAEVWRLAQEPEEPAAVSKPRGPSR